MTAEVVAPARAVHPYADRFPMLAFDELVALAEDIAENGLIHPIVVWIDPETGEELLIDGRNRLAACELSGIEPRAEAYEGNPYAFIRSANIRRRQMTPGQSAMADALALFDQGLRINGRWKRGALNQNLLDNADMQYLRLAGVILDEDPGLAQQVLAGTVTLPAAHDQVSKKRERQRREEEQRHTLATLAGDLLGLIKDGKLPLDQAWAAYQERTRVERERLEQDVKRWRGTAEAVRSISSITGPWMDDYDPDLIGVLASYLETDRLLAARDQIDNLIEWSKQR